ncbi:MAG: hypothetical protein KAK00_01560 [Nanoarchaeota archaeon]|nr:hypothetical protein [Nanoarchaeota archaeon]
MAYYSFDRCSEVILDKIEKIASEIGLRKKEYTHKRRYWEAPKSLAHKNHNTDVLILRYDPFNIVPLLLQTPAKRTHKESPEIGQLVMKLFEISRSTKVMDILLSPYDLSEFY